MTTLDADETLILEIAKATCLSFRLDRDNTPAEDLDVYVGELLRLFQAKPHASPATHPDEPGMDVRSALEFCAQQLSEASPAHAIKLRQALRGR